MSDDMRKVSFWLPAPHDEQINQIAAKRGIKVSEVYRQAAEDFIKFNTVSEGVKYIRIPVPLGVYRRIKEFMDLKLYINEEEFIRNLLNEAISEMIAKNAREREQFEKLKQQSEEALKKLELVEGYSSQ